MKETMIEIGSYLSCILIVCVGAYLVFRSVFVAKKITLFYSNYPLIRCAGEKQMTCRAGLVRFAGFVFVIIGIFLFFSQFEWY